MLSSLQRYIPVFQNYLKAPNSSQYLQNITDPNERKILQAFSSEISNLRDYQKQMSELGLQSSIQRQLLILKLTNYLKTAKDIKQDGIGFEIKRIFSTNKFDYPRPPTVTASDPGEKQDTTPTSIKVQDKLQSYLSQKISQKPQFVRSLNDYAISRIDQKILLDLPLSEKEHLLQKCGIIYHFESSFIRQFLTAFQNEKKNTSPTYKLNTKILSNLTREQIDHLGKSPSVMFQNQDYIELWFNLHYSERITTFVEGAQYFSKLDFENKRGQFRNIVKQLGTYQHAIIKSYVNKLKSQIMFLDVIVGDPCIDRLIQHLQISVSALNITQLNPAFRHQSQQQFKTNKSAKVVPKMRYALQVDSQQPDKLIEDYLMKLFKINDENQEAINKLSQYFNKNYLEKLNLKAQLYKGKISERSHDYYSPSQLEALKDQKQIKLHSTNRRKYRPNDDVELDLSIKNVKNIDIKIYELSLQKHCLNDKSQITDDINLSFLTPAQQYSYSTNISDPYVVIDDTIKIGSDKIPKRMGVFIVDFQGETITSRAIIRKGAILCLQSFTEAGQKFSFHDQEGRPLTAKDGLKVWIKNRPVNLKQFNYFFVDYAEKSEWANIVASMGSYAESFEKQIKAQQYKFDVGYIYNSQSFIVGKRAKIILHGRLTMNECFMSLQLLKNVKVKVTITNNQNITTFYSFNIDNWLDREDPSVEFPIQSYVSNINVAIEGQITLQSKKDVTVAHSKNIKIYLGEDTDNFVDLYLQQTKDSEYVLNLLGLNGEVIPNSDVLLTYSIKGVDQLEAVMVKTDKQGKIHLGKLTIVKTLNAEVKGYNANLQRVWQLDKTQSGFNYTNTIYTKIGQQISIPVDHSWTLKDIVFLRTFDKYYAEDITDRATLKGGKLTLPVISQEGYYILKLLPLDKSIEVWTLKNFKWQGDTEQNQTVYDQQDGKIYQISKNLYQNISITGIKYQKLQNSIKAHVEIDLKGLTEQKLKNVRVHISATNYISSQIADGFKVQNFNTQPKLSEHYLHIKDSAYYNNKNLSDEGAYVWKRQKQNEKFIGNNLQKPGIFLKRALVRQTQQEDQQLNGDDQYIEECALASVDPNLRARLNLKKKAQRSGSLIRNAATINSHNNFILVSGLLQNNLKGNAITVDLPNNYNQLQVLIITPGSAIRKYFSLGSSQSRKIKDLRHAGMADTLGSKGWTMSRQVYELKVGEEKVINRNSQWRTVSLPDIFQFANAKRLTLFQWSTHLLNWHTYPLQKKKSIYDKQCCHELNTFIHFKDPQFFENVVRKFIVNKLNKTFVDYCLLGDPTVKQFASIDQFSRLNSFEKALLVYSLMKFKQQKTAKHIASMLDLQQKSIKRDYQTFKNNFDTIINGKAVDEKAESLSQKRKNLQEMRSRRVQRSIFPVEHDLLDCGSFQSSAVNQRFSRMAVEKKAFVPIQSTKQYTERTYYSVKNYKVQAPRLINPSPFWAELANFFLAGGYTNLLTRQFMTLTTPIDYILAACFISSQSSSNFDLAVLGESYQISARTPMLLYVKEVKELEFANKFGVQINQRFIDPQNMYTYQDGLQIEKEVSEFVVKKPYIAQTVVTNTSGTPLQLQILLDIPKGSIPLVSHEYTQIVNILLKQYTSKQFKRLFYAPQQGEYQIYPSNACRGSTIIAKAVPSPTIQVKSYLTINKLQSFDDILRSGNKQEIIKFIENKNIFDPNTFTPQSILWMLKDKDFYYQIIGLLKERKFYNYEIWNFSFLHSDLQTIREVVNFSPSKSNSLQPAVFEYFPYYSSRTHQFANQTKSTIRNVQFKQTYLKFLVGSVIGIDNAASFAVTFAYYLILQDRLIEARNLLESVSERFPNEHEIQVDYMKCFLDLSLNTQNFSTARQIIRKYKDYPIQSWAKLFEQVRKTLESEDEQFIDSNQNKRTEEFQTQIIQEIGQFKIIQPADTIILVQFFQVNFELFFSDYPFYDYTAFTSVRPSLFKQYSANPQTKEIVIKRSDYPNIKNATIEVTQTKQGLPPKKVGTFQWANSEVKVKVNENTGILQVFVNKKKQAGAYVKVFSKKGHTEPFYRDGYTDMTGTFRYAMSDLQGITEFSILVVTDRGGVVQKVKPPSKLATY